MCAQLSLYELSLLHQMDKEHHPLSLWKPDDAPTLWCPSGFECVKHGAHRIVPLHVSRTEGTGAG